MPKLSRRDFTKGVGLTLLSSPLWSMFGSRQARAQSTPGQAKYLLIFFTNGTDPGQWSPTGSSENSVRFSPMTEPLAPIKDSLVLVERLSSNGTADNHAAPGGLTGLGYSSNQHISVDQFIADGLRAQGVRTPIPSLLLGGVSNEQQTSFYRDGQKLSPIFSPLAAYETIFTGAAPSGGETDGAAAADLLRRRQSMLDVVQGELSRLSRTLDAGQRAKLELHTSSVRQIEERLAGAEQDGGGSGMCAAPAAPMDGSQPLQDSALHLDLAIAAFSCDITRVAAVQFGNHQSTQVSLPEVGSPGDWHNSFIHGDNPRDRLLGLERWLCERFVAACETMKATPAPDGNGTLFDQTLIVWARDMGDAVAHNANDMRFVFAGGAGGYLHTSPEGRYIDGGGDAHQRALITCCQAMGVTDYAGFGDTNQARTPMAEIGG